MKLKIVPCTQKQAKTFVTAVHRHHRPSIGAIFCIGVIDEFAKVRGVAMVGRPVARMIDDGQTVEVTRVATDGCFNACSKLLGACRKIAFEMGYGRIITYTLTSEGGASLRGAGWHNDAVSPGGTWTSGKRKSADDWPTESKNRWSSVNSNAANEINWPQTFEDNTQCSLF